MRERSPYPVFYRAGRARSPPGWCGDGLSGALLPTGGGSVLEASVSEIHRHPLRPPGFAEPLFLGRAAKKEIAEHLACSGWLGKASEAGRPKLGQE